MPTKHFKHLTSTVPYYSNPRPVFGYVAPFLALQVANFQQFLVLVPMLTRYTSQAHLTTPKRPLLVCLLQTHPSIQISNKRLLVTSNPFDLHYHNKHPRTFNFNFIRSCCTSLQ